MLKIISTNLPPLIPIMKKLVYDTDLGIPYTSYLNRKIVDAAKAILGLNELNRLYAAINKHKGVEFASALLKELGSEVRISDDSLDNIPAEGPFIVISNHPHGALDGIAFIDTIIKKRPDTKFMGNFLLSRIEELAHFFMPVDPFDSKSGRNISGVRTALKHLSGGSGMILFPAGEVSTYQRGFGKIEDRQWPESIMKFIRKAAVPIIPAYIHGGNGTAFHLVGKIHPLLRTARLPLELVNKRNRVVPIEIGSAVNINKMGPLSLKEFTDFLRANVYFLRERVVDQGRKRAVRVVENSTETVASTIAEPKNLKEVKAEVDSIRDQWSLGVTGIYEIFCVPSDKIPNLMHEIARLREITFRDVGEGTNSTLDMDKYDKFYEQLFVWDNSTQRLVGAYRVGFGDVIMQNLGIEGFYTYSLFEFTPKFMPVLKQTIELGRSFIVKEYQRKVQPLMLLWRGILLMLMKHPQYNYLMGPVSISGEYSVGAKWMMVQYIKEHCWNGEYFRYVVPRNGLSMLGKCKVDEDLLRGVYHIDMLDKLVRDVDEEHMPVPILIKKYIGLNGRVLSFNVDPAFNNTLDALLLVDINKIPTDSLEMLGKELNKPEVMKRFKKDNTKS